MTSGSGPWVPLASCLQSSPPTAAAQGWIPDPRHCPVLLSGHHLRPTDKPRSCTWLRAGSFPAPAPFVRHLPSLPSSPQAGESPGTSLLPGSLSLGAPPWGPLRDSVLLAVALLPIHVAPPHLAMPRRSSGSLFSPFPPNHLDKLVCPKPPQTSSAPGGSRKSGWV